MKVLIIDDHASIRQTIKAVLSEPETEFIEGTDGDEAVRLCIDNQPDWILLDIKMPRMDGIEAARQIRQLGLTARIIMVTQYDDPGLQAAAADAGVNYYLSKDNLLQVRELIHKTTCATLNLK